VKKAGFVLLPGVLALVSIPTHAESGADYWPTWRGPNADGVAVQGNPPTTWSETENIKWKVSLQDASDCTPVVWGNKIFIQTAVAMEEGAEAAKPEVPAIDRELFTKQPKMPYKFNVVCIDRTTGETLWEKTVREEYPHEGFHPAGGLSNYSPVTDGKFVWVSFGSRGLHCFDVDGNHKWSSDLIPMYSFRGFGEGSSPAIVGDSVVVVADHEGDSKIFSLNKITGELLWEKARDEATSWATPLPVEINGRTEIITSGSNFIRSYDAENGNIIWECSGLTQGAIPSPVISDGKAFFMTGYQDPTLIAINLGGKGDLSTSDAISWTADEGTPYISSPLVYKDRIYMFDNLKANLTCYQASTGKPLFVKERLKGLKQIYASPVGAGGHVYIPDRKGSVMVLNAADTVDIVATNVLEDEFDASPVVVGDELYLKGAKFLYCIAKS
jgi:outer membrane protein assembly factor BamB